MSIVGITIKHFKSIEYCKLALKDITLLIGENGAGKSNILQAIDYFYKNLKSDTQSAEAFDEINSFNNQIEISIEYDITRLTTIARKQLRGSRQEERTQYHNYYTKIVQLYHRAKNGILTVTFSQIRQGNNQWNIDYADRQNLLALFPLHYVCCRDININDWETLWNVIGDFIKLPTDIRSTIYSTYSEQIEDLAVSSKFERLSNEFSSLDVNVEKLDNRSFASTISKMYYDGARFQRKEKRLGYYSTGTNSVNYITLYSKILSAIADFKLKDPLLIFDEPEINLHPQFIDRLFDAFATMSPNMRLLLATHSPRVTKNVLRGNTKHTIYRVVCSKNGYSNTLKMRLFINQSDMKNKYMINDDFANAYFANALLLVEGATEIELFSNDYLRYLYPFLNHLDIYDVMADDGKQSIVSPRNRMTGIPYISVIDMDKCFQYDKSRRAINLKQYLNKPLGEKSHLALNIRPENSRNNTFLLYKRIVAMANKCKFHYGENWYYCVDPNFSEFIECIKKYLLQYHIYACNTTIEGVLVNTKTYGYVLQFIQLKDSNKYSQVAALLDTASSHHARVNILRMVFDGKSDLLIKRDKTTATSDEKEQANTTPHFNKRSGWIPQFIEFYFWNILIEETGVSINDSQFQLDKLIKTCREQNIPKSKLKKRFESDFEELFEIISLCNQLLADIL